MKRLHRRAGLLLALIVICPALAPGLASASPAGRASGHVYTATNDHLVYVMNAAAGSIAGFRLSLRLGPVPVQGSTLPLSAAAVGTDSQIQFDRNGRVLIVDQRGQRAADLRDRTSWRGRATADDRLRRRGTLRIRRRRARPHPDRERIDRRLERASSYDVSRQGVLAENGSPVASGESAACWLAAVGRPAHTTNAGSGSIGTFQVPRARARSASPPRGRSPRTPNLSTRSGSRAAVYCTCSRQG